MPIPSPYLYEQLNMGSLPSSNMALLHQDYAYANTNHSTPYYQVLAPKGTEIPSPTTALTLSELATVDEPSPFPEPGGLPGTHYTPADAAKLKMLVEADVSWNEIQREHFPTRSTQTLRNKYRAMSRRGEAPSNSRWPKETCPPAPSLDTGAVCRIDTAAEMNIGGKLPRVTANSQATATSQPHPHISFQHPTGLQSAYPAKEREPSLRLKNSQQESKRCSRVRKRIPKRHATPSSLKAIGHTGPAACPPTREVNSDRRYTAEEDDFLLKMVAAGATLADIAVAMAGWRSFSSVQERWSRLSKKHSDRFVECVEAYESGVLFAAGYKREADARLDEAIMNGAFGLLR